MLHICRFLAETLFDPFLDVLPTSCPEMEMPQQRQALKSTLDGNRGVPPAVARPLPERVETPRSSPVAAAAEVGHFCCTLRKSALSADMERSTRVRGAHIVLRVIQRMDIFTRNALPLQRATVHAHPVHSKPARRLFAHTGYHSGVPAMRWRAHAHATCHAMTATLLS